LNNFSSLSRKFRKRKIYDYNEDFTIVKVYFEKVGIASLYSHPYSQSTYIAPPDVAHGALCFEEEILMYLIYFVKIL